MAKVQEDLRQRALRLNGRFRPGLTDLSVEHDRDPTENIHGLRHVLAELVSRIPKGCTVEEVDIGPPIGREE